MKNRRWQDWANYFIGLWLFGSPWLLEHSMVTGVPGAGTRAMLNLWTVGLCVILLTIVAIDDLRAWQERAIALLGAWLLLSPWLLGFTSSPLLMWDSVVFGALIVLFAGWAFAKDRHRQRWIR